MTTTIVQMRGSKGLTAAEQLNLAGLIEDPTTAAMDAYLRAPGNEAAASANAAAADAVAAADAAVIATAGAQEVIDAGPELLVARDQAVSAADSVADMRDTLYELATPRITSFGAAPVLVEIGSTETVYLYWMVSRMPASQMLDGVAIAAGDRGALLPGPWPADRVATLDVRDAFVPPHGDHATLTVHARVPIFAGLAAGAVPTADEIRAAQYKALDSSGVARAFALDTTAGGTPFFVVPAALTISAITLGGFAVTGWAMSPPFDLMLATGVTASMRRVSLSNLPSTPGTIGVTLA